MNHRLPALGGRQQPGKSQKMNGMLQWFKNLHNVEHLETTKTKGSLETDSKPRSRWLQMLKMASTTLDSHVKKRGAGSESLAVSWGDTFGFPIAIRVNCTLRKFLATHARRSTEIPSIRREVQPDAPSTPTEQEPNHKGNHGAAKIN